MVRLPVKSQGFTLIEMVVALTILSLIVLATVTALRTLAKTQSTLNLRTQSIAEMRAVTGFVRRSLEQAVSVTQVTLNQSTPTSFYGTENDVVWAAPMPIPGGLGGLSTLKLYLNDSQQLIILVLPFTPLAPEWSNARSFVLMEGVQAFSIAYKDVKQDAWVLLWDPENRTQAPSHIKLSLQINERYWPELIIALVDVK